MTLCIFILGAGTVILSMWAAVLFSRVKKGKGSNLSSAITWQLSGEAFMGAVTMLFAAAAYFEWLPHWSVEFQSFLRFCMFAVTAATTLHLVRTIKQL